MSNLALLTIGLFVTLMVAGSISLLIWGAILDGRDEDERLAREREREPAEAEVVRLETVPGNVVSLDAFDGGPLTRGAA